MFHVSYENLSHEHIQDYKGEKLEHLGFKNVINLRFDCKLFNLYLLKLYDF